MDDPGEALFAFFFGIIVTLLRLTFACTPPHELIKAHSKAAMGCTVIPAEEAVSGVVDLPRDAVYWRCKDGKVYVR